DEARSRAMEVGMMRGDEGLEGRNTPRDGEKGIAPVRHGCRSRMGGAANPGRGELAGRPGSLDDADPPLGLRQDPALLDMQFDIGFRARRNASRFAGHTDRIEGGAERNASPVLKSKRIVQWQGARKDAAAGEARLVARAFLVRPVDDGEI